MLPANEWWGILGGYGAAIWPGQALFFCSGLVLSLFLLLSRKPIYSLLMLVRKWKVRTLAAVSELSSESSKESNG